MFRIKRTKAVCKLDGSPLVAVHYVARVSDTGSIDALAANVGEACELTAEQVAKVQAYHAVRKHGGTLEAERIGGEPVQPQPEPEADEAPPAPVERTNHKRKGYPVGKPDAGTKPEAAATPAMTKEKTDGR